jgi:transcriptional regulator with XRE-family HTH domain
MGQAAERSDEDRERAGAMRRRRLELGLTQAALADLFRTSQQTVGRWERGFRPQPRFRPEVEAFIRGDWPAKLIPMPGLKSVDPGEAEPAATDVVQRELLLAFARRASLGPMAQHETETFRVAFASADRSRP